MMVALILIGLLVLVVIILGLVAPQNYHVSRSVMIEKPRSRFFRMSNFFKNKMNGHHGPEEILKCLRKYVVKMGRLEL